MAGKPSRKHGKTYKAGNARLDRLQRMQKQQRAARERAAGAASGAGASGRGGVGGVRGTREQARRQSNDPLIGTEQELEIKRIAHGGFGVATLEDGRVAFVADTLPGERVRARITDGKKSFAKAVTLEVLDESEHRVPHIWEEADVSRAPEQRAGGAEFGHISLPVQRDLKAQVLMDSLRRMGGFSEEDVAHLTVQPIGDEIDEGNGGGDGLGWRTRVRLHVDPVTGRVGPYAHGTNTVVPVSSLPLADERLQQIAPLDAEMPDVTSVQLVAPAGDEPRMLLTYEGEKAAVGAEQSVLEYAGDWNLLVPAGGFWQVHRDAATTLLTAVAESVRLLGDAVDPAAMNLDLYGGVGLLAAGFLDAAGDRARITTVESVESATDLAAENLGEFHGVQAFTASVEDYLADMQGASVQVRDRIARGTVILDPPRKGAGIDVMRTLADLQPQNVIYVACDPVALARDSKVLMAAGYELVAMQGFDLFPHTHHFETVAVFTK